MNFRAIRIPALVLALAATSLAAWTAVGECQFTARLFTIGSNSSIHLSATNWCVELEPENNAFTLESIDPNTVVLFSSTYPPVGSVDQISPMNKTYIVADRDGNGIQDIELCFSNADLNTFFDKLHGKKPKTVTIGVSGNLTTGGIFGSSITIDVYPMD
jgi:hypothetical protein